MKFLKQLRNFIRKASTPYTGTSSEKNQYSSKSGDNEIISGTPLWLTKGNEDGTVWFLTFANYKLKEAPTKEELVSYYNANTVNLLTDIMLIIIQLHEEKKGK